MLETINHNFEESIEVKRQALEANRDKMVDAVNLIIDAMKKGNKVMFCGNGGSAADSQHIAAEFIGRFQKERQSLPAMALTTDSSILTALGNDYSYDIVFSRQIQGIGKPGDVLFGISTSGNSKNVVEAVKTAKEKNIKTIALLGGDGGQLGNLVDLALIVPSKKTARIQESHLCIAHTICELVEETLAE